MGLGLGLGLRLGDRAVFPARSDVYRAPGQQGWGGGWRAGTR